ncbi:MAG: hypothetical protein ABR552_06230 [Actinomycetota bacterium]|nr:hypothetical protein [Actinomycetota bacterium]
MTDRKRKRAHKPRKIVPRGRMGIHWVIGTVVLAVAILIVGVVFLLRTT